jgi:hypothetical protein
MNAQNCTLQSVTGPHFRRERYFCGPQALTKKRRRMPPLRITRNQDRQYDQAWGVVHKARSSKKWIAPELLDTW